MNVLDQQFLRPTSHAAYLPPVPRPPHDPLTLLLDGRVGWRPLAGAPASSVAPVGIGGALALVALPGSGRGLLETSGSFGGLVAPRHVALAPVDRCRHDLLLYDAARRRLLRFDPCACAFVAQSCLRAGDRRLPAGPAALAAARGRLYLADRVKRRVVVLNAATLALRGVWRAPLDAPPCQATDRLDEWEPSALAIAPNGDVWVAERLHGLLLRFAPNGCVRERHAGFGSVTALAVTCAGELLMATEGTPALVFYDPANRRRLAPPRRPAELIGRFPVLPFKAHADGSLDLSRLCQPQCAAPCVFGPDGALLDAPPDDPPERYPAVAEWVSEALDSGIADCVWDRLAIRAGLAPHTRIVVDVRTSETLLEADQVLAAEGWTQAALLRGEADADTRVETDFMLRAAPGRFLWLRLRLETNGDATPVVEGLDIDYPRVSWRRYLPAVFGADPVGAEFLDRWLAIFDRGFRDIETNIDTQARLFDPMSAPAGAGQDFLGFLASWVGLQAAASLPLARRRAFIRAAPALYPWRGTPRALRDMLYLFFGLERWSGHRAPNAACVPCPTRIPEHLRWRPPRMLLEHYVLRRWLWLGVGRLSDNARLWGERIVNRSPLGAGAPPSLPPGCPRPGADAAGGAGCIGPAQSGAHGTASEAETAQLGVTQLKTSQDPLRDPFHVHAHGLSAFVPAACLRDPSLARTLGQLLKADVPAHVHARLVPVEARMRVGVQAMLGLDAVIGYRTAPVALDEAALGKGTVLGGENPDGGGSALRVGGRRVGMDTRLK